MVIEEAQGKPEVVAASSCRRDRTVEMMILGIVPYLYVDALESSAMILEGPSSEWTE